MPLDPALHPHLLCSLAAASEANRVGRKLLLASTRGEARELLRALTLASGGSIGWSAVTGGDPVQDRKLFFVRDGTMR